MNLLSNNTIEIAQSLKTFIKGAFVENKKAKQGIDYYQGRNDIINNKIMWIDENGTLKEDKNASNVKIPHRFMTELTDQKVQFLLSNPIVIEVEDENDELKELLADYYNSDFQQMLQDLLTNASQKGFEYVYAQTSPDNKVEFIVADGLKIVPVTDGLGNVVKILRYWQENITVNGSKVMLNHAELYDQDNVTYFIAKNNDEYILDESIKPNPRPHVINIVGDDVIARSYGHIPFYRMQNNAEETTDLEPIKELIDDYDLMNAFMSNNLQDMAEAIYVLNGDVDMSTAEMRQNIKAKKSIITGGEGNSFDLKTFDIPTQARMDKMSVDRENIYKFGMGVDSLNVGDGNITNVVIMSRYELLNMKANKLETRVKALMKWINELVIADINRINGTQYLPTDVEIAFERSMLINQLEQATIDKSEADKQGVEVQTLLASAPYLDQETIVRRLSEILDVEAEDVIERLRTQEYGNDGAGINTTD